MFLDPEYFETLLKTLRTSSAPGDKAVAHVLRFFRYNHLPPHLQEASKPFAELAARVASGPKNPETTVSLRKLLEAKDAAVRALLPEEG